MSEMKNWKQILKHVDNYIAFFSSQYVAGSFHWESTHCLSTVPNIFTLSTIFPLSWGKRQLKTAEVSWGCCLLFGHVLLFFCPVQLHQAMPTPQKPGLMKTHEMEDVHSSESCTVPMFWIPMLIIPGMAEGRAAFLSFSLMFQANTTKSIPTLWNSHTVFIP